ncbi:MAG: carbohydrate binding family 9 domain-containing protein [Bacteroidales bacterium]|nr:carbohydrate binding family 9 domain-containing protein [Bacteroidales bacterium]
MKKCFLILILLFFFGFSYSQEIKRINAYFSDEKPKIDGFLYDSIWLAIPYENNFLQFEPYNGEEATQQTLVKLAYDNSAVYIAAECKTNKEGEVFSILSERDDFGQADYFGFYLDPYNTGITGYGFFVTAAGVQVDMKIDNNSQNFDWDAVWFSKVNVSDSGFIVEMRIPYSAFRFPQKDKQSWRINFYRNIQQNREISTWNYVDNSKTGILNQLGFIDNVKNIHPPLRLSFLPYISSYVQKYTNSPELGQSYNGGLDFKLGINESFTLDMMLIPDFNQIQSDDQVLNLSPYETYYDDKRYFFTEGVEIFNKGDIFYSRRIGKEPTKFDEVEGLLSENEVVVKNPPITQIFNATKFSGKTNKGLGIGFLNAFTGSSYAEILDTLTDNRRTILTEPFSNYNVFALNQPLPNNSFISLTNTNFSSFGRNYTSFVTAEEGYLRNRKNSWAISEKFALSHIFNDTLETNKGFAYRFAVAKTSGKFRVSLSQQVYSSNYNPNDLGYLRQNNIISNSLGLSYNIYKPFWHFLLWRNSFSINQQSLYDSLRYIGADFIFNSSVKFRNNFSAGIQISLTPDEVYDYFEPRAENMFYVRDPNQSFQLWVSSNYAESFAYDIIGEVYFAKLDEFSQYGFSLTTSPRIRFSDNAFFVYSNNLKYDYNNFGYVGNSETLDSVFFGKRNLKYTTNTFEFDYIFAKNVSMSLKMRHYWSLIDYYKYYTLGKNGKLYPLYYSYRYLDNKDLNYNAFTVDFYFKWIFLPGSEFSVVLKKQIISSSDDLINDYYDNFEYMYFKNSHLNSISFKFIYYIDYNSLRNIR